jgi:hypothetical protein
MAACGSDVVPVGSCDSHKKNKVDLQKSLGNCVSLTPKTPSTAAVLPWLARVFHTDKTVMPIP